MFKYLLFFTFISFSLLGDSKIQDAFANGNVDGEIQAFYYNINKKRDSFSHATALGGFLKYTTDTNNSFFGTVGFHTSNSIGSSKKPKATLLFNNDKDASSFSVVSEAFLAYKTSSRVIKIGNLMLNTPMANDDTTRIVPFSYQAFAYTGNITQDTRVELYYINAIRSNTSDSYKKKSASGEIGDSGVSMLGLHYSGMEGIKFHSYYYYAPELYSTLVLQSDYEYAIDKEMLLCFGVQYFNSGDGGEYANTTGLYGGDDINLLALRANVEADDWHVSLNYSQNFGLSGILRGYGGLAKVYTSSMIANGRGNYKPETWMLKTSYELPFKSHHSEVALRVTNTKVHDSRGYGFNAYYLHFKHYFSDEASLFVRYENMNFEKDKIDSDYLRIIAKYEF